MPFCISQFPFHPIFWPFYLVHFRASLQNLSLLWVICLSSCLQAMEHLTIETKAVLSWTSALCVTLAGCMSFRQLRHPAAIRCSLQIFSAKEFISIFMFNWSQWVFQPLICLIKYETFILLLSKYSGHKFTTTAIIIKYLCLTGWLFLLGSLEEEYKNNHFQFTFSITSVILKTYIFLQSVFPFLH